MLAFEVFVVVPSSDPHRDVRYLLAVLEPKVSEILEGKAIGKDKSVVSPQKTLSFIVIGSARGKKVDGDLGLRHLLLFGEENMGVELGQWVDNGLAACE